MLKAVKEGIPLSIYTTTPLSMLKRISNVGPIMTLDEHRVQWLLWGLSFFLLNWQMKQTTEGHSALHCVNLEGRNIAGYSDFCCYWKHTISLLKTR
ncbi:hypothetical protein M5689_000868 [Euphorbia peplus]|nr:hypothetical protein M5689_000868 [Euphorbia peplus]